MIATLIAEREDTIWRLRGLEWAQIHSYGQARLSTALEIARVQREIDHLVVARDQSDPQVAGFAVTIALDKVYQLKQRIEAGDFDLVPAREAQAENARKRLAFDESVRVAYDNPPAHDYCLSQSEWLKDQRIIGRTSRVLQTGEIAVVDPHPLLNRLAWYDHLVRAARAAQ